MPVLGAIIFAVTWGNQPPTAVLVMVGLLLAGCVFAAVHHAEVVAHRVGEPFGALILAVAVTVIEVGLIVMLMVSGGPDTSTLARDTVFAAAMITCNGIVGLALLVGSLQPGVASFKPEGTAPALATVAHVGHPHTCAAHVHHQYSGSGILRRATGFRLGRIAGAVFAVRFRPDCA